MGLKESGLRGSLRNVSVGIDAIPDSVVNSPDQNNTGSFDVKRGVELSTEVEWPEIGAELFPAVDAATRAYVFRMSDGELMGDVDITGKSGGDTFTISFDDALTPDDNYNLTIDAEGSSYDNGWVGSADFPFTSDDGDLSIVAGTQGETGESGDLNSFAKIGNVGFD